jgi:hypothetical protein
MLIPIGNVLGNPRLRMAFVAALKDSKLNAPEISKKNT